MRETAIGIVLSKAFGWGPLANCEPLCQLILIIISIMLAVLAVGLFTYAVVVLLRHKGEVKISREDLWLYNFERDPLGVRKRTPSPKSTLASGRWGRQQRRLGSRTRRRE